MLEGKVADLVRRWHVEPSRKILGIILLGIVSSILAVVLWESSLFKSWHTGNPIDAAFKVARLKNISS